VRDICTLPAMSGSWNCGHGRTVNPQSPRKRWTGNPPPIACASSRFYHDSHPPPLRFTAPPWRTTATRAHPRRLTQRTRPAIAARPPHSVHLFTRNACRQDARRRAWPQSTIARLGKECPMAALIPASHLDRSRVARVIVELYSRIETRKISCHTLLSCRWTRALRMMSMR